MTPFPTGVGRDPVALYLSGHNHNMIAVVRTPSHASIETLTSLAIGASDTFFLLEIDKSEHSDTATATKLLQSEYDVTHVNTIIANTGICHVGAYGQVARVKCQCHSYASLVPGRIALALKMHTGREVRKTFRCYGMLRLWNSLRTYPAAAHGAFKSALTYLTREVHFNREDLMAWAIDLE